MMGNNSLSYSLLAGLCFSLPVQANDSTAAMGTGGLVFTQSEHIVMAEEDLFVSQKKVRVQYRFTNTSSRDITTRVAFPLPDLPIGADGSPLDYQDESELPKDLNILKFSVVVNGKAQPFKTEHKKRQEDGITLHTLTHHWQQTFPAGKTISVSHEYVPALGGSVGYGMQGEETGRYCIDPELQRWVDKKIKDHWEIPTTTLHYILTTGANWKGPIGKFRLTLKKSDPKEKLSFCGTGVKKIDDRTFVMEKTNFVPKQDLHVIYLREPYRLEQ